MVIAQGVSFGESTANINHPYIDLDIFRIDFDHAEKEMIVVGENSVFEVANFNYCHTDKHWIDYFYPKTVIKYKGVPINQDNIALLQAA